MKRLFLLILSAAALCVVCPPDLSAAASPQAPSLDLSACLIGHYTFDGHPNDASPNGFHGTLVGSPSYARGKVGSAALRVTTALDGSSFNYVTLGTAPIPFIETSDFSVSLWVKYHDHTQDSPFISNKDWNSGGNIGFVVADSGNGIMKQNIQAGGGSRVDGSFVGRTDDGVWHHVAVVYQRASADPAAVLYLDGAPMETNSLADVIGSINSGLPLNIGQDGTGTYTWNGQTSITNGLIDDVGVWCRTLSDEEVAYIFLEGSQGLSFDGVNTFPPLVLVPPQNTDVLFQGRLVLSVEAGGSEPLTYQWYHDVDALTDQTNATLVIDPVSEFDWGPYHMDVSNPYGGPVSSPEAWVNVLFNVPAPEITQSPQSLSTNQSLDVTFTAAASGDFLRYQWQFEGTNLPGATNTSLFLPTVGPAQAGDYTFIVTNFGGAVTSAPATLTVVLDDYPLVLSQWDFRSGTLAASCGTDLEYFDATVESETFFGTTTSFGIADIAGHPAPVMRFSPPMNSGTMWGGYKMYHGAPPNGGGAYVNKYTLIYDLLYPASSGGYRSLFQSNTSDSNDGDFFINPSDGIGISGSYQGDVTPDQWHRIIFGVDLTVSLVTKYIDGVRVANQTLGSGLDGRWSLDPYALLLADDDGEIAPGYLSSFQFRNVKITDAEVAALGAPTASKIPGCNPPPALTIALIEGSVVINHPGVGLEEADNVEGPYTEIVGAPDPYLVDPATSSKKFYRPMR